MQENVPEQDPTVINISSRGDIASYMNPESLVLKGSHIDPIYEKNPALKRDTQTFQVIKDDDVRYDQITIDSLVAEVKENPANIPTILDFLGQEIKQWRVLNDLQLLSFLPEDDERAIEIKNGMTAKITGLENQLRAITIFLEKSKSYFTQSLEELHFLQILSKQTAEITQELEKAKMIMNPAS